LRSTGTAAGKRAAGAAFIAGIGLRPQTIGEWPYQGARTMQRYGFGKVSMACGI